MSDGPASNRHELDEERAVNERYLKALSRRVQEGMRIAHTAPRARNEIWAGNPLMVPISASAVDVLYGRVALDPNDPLLEEGFYVGSWHHEWEDLQVISWAAPVAKLFYEGTKSDDPSACDVIARRTFEHRLDDIVHFVDDVDRPEVENPFRAKSRRLLNVPRAPRPAVRPRLTGTPTGTTDSGGAPARRRDSAHEIPDTQPVADLRVLRAEEVVRKSLERPRTGRLSAVLTTLQPDQYRLVTWPDDRPLIVQGHPGTGKTVIATHRAAYLLHPEREGPSLARVGVVGPTQQYVHHVTAAVDELDVQGVDVVSLPELLLRQSGLKTQPSHHGPDQRLDTHWALGSIAKRANAALADGSSSRRGHAERVRRIVDALAKPPQALEQVFRGYEELRTWLDGVDWSKATRDWRFVPFLAAVGQAVRPPDHHELFDHLIVDEAQDVRPLEWRILLTCLRPGGSVSLFGDTNQRRSDWTAMSWTRLAEDLELTDGDGRFEVEVLDTGYRSTREILRFASHLLPKEGRQLHSLRTGPEPTVHKTRSDELATRASALASHLSDRHPDGLVAVLTMDPRETSDQFRKQGWARGRLQHSWQRNGQTVAILHPSNARGLEFDGVVVVEPADFPPNLGRLGLLYTSLTRATKELVVVHAKSLPKALRARKS